VGWRSVAWVGEYLAVGFFLAPVEGREVGAAHIDLAAHLEDPRPSLALQRLGDLVDGAHVGGDVLAGGAVAAGGRQAELSLVIEKGAGKAVYLGLRQNLGRFAQIEEARDARQKVAYLLLAEGIGQRQHGYAVAHFLETA
jgi:hypothetical protein